METPKERVNLIRTALQKLNPSELTIDDESQEHVGHAGARSGGGHFAISIVSNAFVGKSAVQRHQMIYEALGDLMKHEIHAIRIQAKIPEEI
jgi:BolA protein